MKTTFQLFLFSTLFFSLEINAQISFQKNYGTSSMGDYGQSVVQAIDSGYFVTGVRVDGISLPVIGDSYLKRTDKYGNEIWTNFYSTPGSSDLTFDHIEKTSDSNLVMAGVVNYGFGDYDVYLTKMDTSGNVLWFKNYGGQYRQRGLQVKETFDNGFIIGGWNETNGNATSSFYLIKTNSVGDTIWTRAYPNNRQQYGYAVTQTPDSGFVIVGSIQQPLQIGTDVYIIKTNSFGDTLWTKIIDYSGSSQARDVVIAGNGNIVITGFVSPTGCADAFLTELNQNGSIVWFQNYDSGFCEWAYSLCKTNDGGYALFGMDGSSDYYLIKTDASGNQSWFKKFDETSTDYGYNVRQTSDNGFIMTGITVYSSDINIILIKTDSTGSFPTDIEQFNGVSEQFVYPNPTGGIFNLNLKENSYVTIYNITGEIVKNVFIQPGEVINIEELTNGMYFAEFNSENHTGKTKLLLVK